MDELKNIANLKSSAAEFVAVLLFVFIGAGVVVSTGTLTQEMTPARLTAIALAHGLTICMLVYATAHISGGHINPAVTIATMITGKTPAIKGVMFIIAQLLGGIVGAYLLYIAVPSVAHGSLGAHALAPGVSITSGLIAETALTFVLVFIVFATATDDRAIGSMAPFAIGLAVLVAHLVAVPLTGTGINPARSLGPAIATQEFTNIWIYFVGPVIGAVLAGIVYQYVLAVKK